MQKFLGIDVGGTNVKCGIVTEDGQILHQAKYRTDELRESGDFVKGFLKIVESQLLEFPDVHFVGIGVPGTLNKARTTTAELPNIPEFDNVNISERLGQEFPNHSFRLENDANAAALGEYYFSPEEMPEDFIFVTLGTGVGGAAIIDQKIFTGGGNSMEIGHILSEGGKSLEHHIGKKGMYAMATQLLSKYKEKSRLYNEPIINTRLLIESASMGDPLALEVFNRMGYLLGVTMVGVIRVLDIKNIYIGGGISNNFEFMKASMLETLTNNLTPYYVNALTLKKANLGNEAGLLGAASLCFEQARQATV